MGGSQPPFMYQAIKDDERFPAVNFDPKAVTRASYEPKKQKAKPDGPLVSINRHPDAHMVPNGRSRFRPMGRRTKGWIKGMRVVQIGLRVIQITAAVGLITVMSVAGLMGWVMGVTLGVVLVHCGYSIFHHFRPAGARTPGSSAAYQLFSGFSDICVLPLYAYGAILARNKNEEWKTKPPSDPNVVQYMVPSVYYGLIGAGGLHLLSLAISLWLGLMFRRIANMPPDMNPLEANLTSRVAHKRNKSSVATTSTYYDEKSERGSRLYDDDDEKHSVRPRSIPFMHTRQGSDLSSLESSTRDSRINLPSRQYQVPASHRSSVSSQDIDRKRMSAPPSPSKQRASYMEIPLGETGSDPVSPSQTAQPRPARFTETWYTSESLISRTQKRNRTSAQAQNQGHCQSASEDAQNAAYHRAAAYASLDASDPDDDSDNDITAAANTFYTPAQRGIDHDNNNDDNTYHPNPLRSHPTDTTPTNMNNTPPSSTPASAEASAARRPRTPFSRLRNSVLSTISLNDRRVSGSQDITDQTQQQIQSRTLQKKPNVHQQRLQQRNRDSSIQADSAFFSKPYGELKAATPPILVGGKEPSSDDEEGVKGGPAMGSRVVSSGNDYGYDLGVSMGRRNVSGRAAEEGRAGAGAGERWSRYSVLNE
ncbi:uncharacterized protein C8A04DRAFT_39734 [Dichotomopilus funicola]|uniref:Uncharacterized protein n=1 Tax=Dichotomopilus funicola TaxID=1934379 RepID=A0AAN6ZKF6_9PEZI|nr:hypothetical protein C8A04DRAFT_39734 [Dichotomopilus funicola]